MISFFRKLQWWLQRRTKEQLLDEELQFHMQEEMEEGQARGVPAEEARWAARRDLGNTTLLREDTRTLWSWVVVEQLAQDVRYGLRGMFKNPVFTSLAALSLALGIGANTAIYSLSLIHISEPTRLLSISYAVFCLKKKKIRKTISN